MRKLLAALLLCSCSSHTSALVIPPTTESTTTTTTQAVQAPPTSIQQIETTAPKDTVSPDELLKNALRQNNPCDQWLETALQEGWPAELWHQQSYVIWRESRCNFDSWNQSDPNGGSRGLMQINGFWCQKWLQAQHILNTCEDLFDPAINLRAAWAIYNYSVDKNKNGWHPWSMKTNFVPPPVAD